MPLPVRLLITDVDNTLYDWLGFYIPSFLAMVEEVHRITGIEIPALKQSFRRLHQARGTSEYAFALQELDVLAEIDARLSVEDRLKKYDPAIHAFRSVRKRTLRLYPGVRETLARLKAAGIVVVAHSDSMMSYVSRRLRQLEVDGLLAAICAPRDHGVPATTLPAVVRREAEDKVAARTLLLESPPGIRKPNPETIAPVFAALDVSRQQVLYVGDSLSRDVLLARRANLRDAWAEYGTRHDTRLVEELLQITYWTEQEIAEEARLRAEISERAPSSVIASFEETLALCGVA